MAVPIDMEPTMPKGESEREKITETMRSEALRRVDGKLTPSVLKDAEISGFALHVTASRAFWAMTYQPRGVNPATDKRWGGGVRHELGDAMIDDRGRSPHRGHDGQGPRSEGPRSAPRSVGVHAASAVAERAVLPQTVADVLDAYAKALMARREPQRSHAAASPTLRSAKPAGS